MFNVGAKRVEVGKTTGEAKVMLQGEPRSGVALVSQAQTAPGTLTHRIIRQR